MAGGCCCRRTVRPQAIKKIYDRNLSFLRLDDVSIAGWHLFSAVTMNRSGHVLDALVRFADERAVGGRRGRKNRSQ